MSNHEHYQGSKEHKLNAKLARGLANLKDHHCTGCDRSLRKVDYPKHIASCLYREENARFCKGCGTRLYKPVNQFCGSSCSASFNIVSEEHRMKTSKSGQVYYKNASQEIKALLSDRAIRANQEKYNSLIATRVQPVVCSYCENIFWIKGQGECHRKTCSKECSIKASTSRSYQNGSRKTLKYFNTNQQRFVTLESSWELRVAEELDLYKVRWIRPSSLVWLDAKGKTRLYYPDFYLLDYDLYLDPKNPYCMKLDQAKMEYISLRYKIAFGSLNFILKIIPKMGGQDTVFRPPAPGSQNRRSSTRALPCLT